MYFLDHIWLIPLFPAFGAVCMFLFGRRLSKSAVNGVCVGVVVLAFVWAALAVWQYSGYQAASPGKPFEKVMYTWLGTGTTSGAEAPEKNSGADANLKVRPTSSFAGAEAPEKKDGGASGTAEAVPFQNATDASPSTSSGQALKARSTSSSAGAEAPATSEGGMDASRSTSSGQA